MGSYFKWELAQRQEQLDKLLSGRESLDDDEFFRRHFESSGISREVAVGVRQVFAEILEADLGRLVPTDDFSKEFALFWEWDSLANVDLIVGLEKRFGIRIADAEAVAMKTVWDIVSAVQRKVTTPLST